MRSFYDEYIIAMMFILGIILFFFGYAVGEDKGVDKFVNKLCQQTQYEFCQPTYKYTTKKE